MATSSIPPPAAPGGVEWHEDIFLIATLAALVVVPFLLVLSILLWRLIDWAVYRITQAAAEADQSKTISWVMRRMSRSRHVRAADRGSRRARLLFFLHLGPKAKWGLRWDLLQAVLASIGCVMYVVNTYATVEQCTLFDRTFELAFEVTGTLLFTADYFLNFFLSPRRIRHVLSIVPIAELLTVIPVWLQAIMIAVGIMDIDDIAGCTSANFAFVKFLRLARFLRIVRLARFLRGQDADSFRYHVWVLCMSIFSIVLVAACAFQWYASAQGANPMTLLPCC